MMKKNDAFTLLEIAIVVAIIALVIGGVMTGKMLVKQSELRAVLQEYDRYTKATKEFLDKYQQLPGDYTEAQAAWGQDSGTCPINTYTATFPSGTCNGDGDGKIAACVGDFDSSSAAACYNTHEAWRVWQHLAKAGFIIEGRYLGRAGGTASATQATPGLNVPASKLKPGGWTLVHYTNLTDNSWLIGDQYGHVFLFGGGKGAWDGVFTTEPVISTTDAYEMDVKIDDGIPTSGSLRAWNNYWAPRGFNGPTSGVGADSYCVDTNAYFTDDGTYNDQEFSCSLIFIPGF